MPRYHLTRPEGARQRRMSALSIRSSRPFYSGASTSKDYYKKRNLQARRLRARARAPPPAAAAKRAEEARSAAATAAVTAARAECRAGRRHGRPSADGRAAAEGRAHRASSATASPSAMFITAASRPNCICAIRSSSSSCATWATSGDTPGFRPHPVARSRSGPFPVRRNSIPTSTCITARASSRRPTSGSRICKADTIVAFFGYNESFDGPSRWRTSRRNSTPGCSTR